MRRPLAWLRIRTVGRVRREVLGLLVLLLACSSSCAGKPQVSEPPSGLRAQDRSVARARPSPALPDPAPERLADATDAPPQGPSDPPPSADGFPLDSLAVDRCAPLLSDGRWDPSSARGFELALAALPSQAAPANLAWDGALEWIRALGSVDAGHSFVSTWTDHIVARREGLTETLPGLQELLAAAEGMPLYHVGVAAYVWRRASRIPASAVERAELMARLERHLRVARALLLGLAETGPVEFSTWQLQTAPPGYWTGIYVKPGLYEAALRHYPGLSPGTWEWDGTIEVTVEDAGVTLLRGGEVLPIQPGTQLVLRRLDVLQAEAPARLQHAELGDMSLRTDDPWTAWDAPRGLSAAAKARVRRLVAAALAGDTRARERLAPILPAAHLELRRALAHRPRAPGASRLRALLGQFDG